jgi:hypothetical protein
MKYWYITCFAAGILLASSINLHIPSDTGIMVQTKIEALRRYSKQHYKEKWVDMDSYSYERA